MIWLALIAVALGLFLLVKSADAFIDGATEVAVKFNMPSFLIGVLILGIGTSAPEMVVSALSAMSGSPGLALGNAYGSNILNIALVLGLTVCISPLVIRASVVKQDLMLLVLVTMLSAYLLSDGHLSIQDGVMLLLALAVVLILQIWFSLRNPEHGKEERQPNMSLQKAILLLFVGLVILIFSSRMIVWGAVELAKMWGLSELMIGLTIVAIGTSLPELVASVVAARKGEHEMALGNIIGSNLFNTLGVVGLAAIIAPMQIEPEVLSRDMLMVGIMTGLLLVMCVVALKVKRNLSKPEGVVFLSVFLAYTAWLIQSAAPI